MTSIEERLARDIAAVTGGVVVTDSELLESRKAIDERIGVQRRRSRVRLVAGVAAAAAAVAVGGAIVLQTAGDDDGKAQPANTPSAPTVPSEFADYLIGEQPTNALLDGVWRLDNGLVQFRFAGDGTVWISDEGEVFGHPAMTATYEVDGYNITFTATDASEPECVGQQFAVPASVARPGTLRYATVKSSACSPLPVGFQALEQVLPTSEAMKFENSRGWRPAKASVDLYGDFVAEGGGYVLELDRDGTYYVANESGDPIDQGRWERRADVLTLTSSAQSSVCQQGDLLRWSGLETTTHPGTLVFRGTVTKNTCDSAWTPTGWVLIPNAGG